MKNKEVCAIVVTYNRKKVLEEQIKTVLFKQKFKIDKYFIVDNCSTDNTEEMINEYKSKTSIEIEYLKTSSNCGGAGGFEFGLRKAFEEKFEWYILMDDDGRPYDEFSFFNMYQYIKKNKYDSSQKILFNSIVQCDDSLLAFGIDHIESVEEALKISKQNFIESKANPFNGTWISKSLVETIGFPNGAFFIKGDENDYLLRAKNADAFVGTVVSSKYFHPRSAGYEKKKVFGRDMYVFVEAPWKEYYSMRNYTYSFMKNKKFKNAFILLLKRIYCCCSCECNKIGVIKMIFKGFFDGIAGKLGITIKP